MIIFLFRVISVFMERVTQLLEYTPEFQMLRREDQSILLNENRNRAAALTVAKLESFKDGNEQLRFALGHFDDAVFSQDYACVLPNKKLKRFSLFEGVDSCCPDRNICLQLVCQINSLVKDMEVYKLFLLLLLFKTEKVRDQDLENLALKYETLLMQTLAIGDKEEGRNIFEEILRKVQDLTSSVFGDTFSRGSSWQKIN